MEFDRWTVLFLLRRTDAPTLSPSEGDAIQDAHLAHLARLHADGRLLAAGPVERSPDSALAGVCIFRTSPDEARALEAEDPAVHAGILRTETYSWSVPRGTVEFLPSRFPRSTKDVASP